MKINKVKEELKKLDYAQLKEQAENVSKELFAVRMNAKTAHMKDYSKFNKLRKLVAQIKTFMRQRELHVSK